MATYYDERPRHSDSRRPRQDDGSYYRERRSREHSPDRSRLVPDDRFYSSRYSYPPSRPPSRPVTPRTTSSTKAAVRSSWPPSPAVEDESVSLAREANPPAPAEAISEARSRGTLEQQPIILDAFGPPRQNTAQTNKTSTAGNRTPPTASHTTAKPGAGSTPTTPEEKAADRGRKPSQPRDLEIPGLPDFSRRAPSPYVFTPKAPRPSDAAYTDSGYFSSSDVRNSKLSTPTPGKPNPNDGFASDALRGQGRQRYTLNTSARSSVSEGSPDDRSDLSTNSNGPRKPAKYSFPKSDLRDKDPRTSSRDAGGKSEAKPRVAEIKANAVDGVRRSSESASTMQRPKLADLAPRGHPKHTSQAFLREDATSNSYYDNSRSGSSSSQPSSPAPSSPRSPRGSTAPSQDDLTRSGRSSRPNSRPSSRQNSPVRGGNALRYDEPARRSSTFPAIPDDRSQRTSKLASSTTTSDIRSPVRAPAASSLPYPVDDMNLMPSEEDHRYIPRALDDPFVPHASMSSTSKKAAPVASSPRSRPKITSRHTSDAELPTLAAAAGISESRTSQSPSSAAGSGNTASKALKPCPRMQSSRGHDDWYTLDGCPSFDICPTCLDSNFSSSMFRKYFKRSERKDPSQKTKCDFGSPWMRTAWLLTQDQHRFDLDLVYAVARVNASESPCPGSNTESRTWHTLLDDYGYEVKNFDVCSCDVKRIEALLPTLSGYFKRAHSAGRKRKCDMRIESPRFSEYMDMLIEIDSTAMKKRKRADVSPFVELAQHKAQTRECSRDDLVLDQSWHFTPQLPEFTVCEECYSTVVWPAIADGSGVATRFNRTPKLVVEEQPKDPNRPDAPPVVGTSCQLYSPRMRTVFRRAVESSDFNYLARRARERKAVELELQSRFAALQQVAADLSKAPARAGERSSWQQQKMSGLQLEFDKMMTEWRRWE